MKTKTNQWLISCVALMALGACSSSSSKSTNPAPYDPSTPFVPQVSPEDLQATVNNPLFPLPLGARWVYEAETPDGLERIEVIVKHEPKDVWGTTATSVQDTVTVDGEIVEDTTDWYAQDSDGHVWYMGEDTCEFEDGECVLHAGAWTAGVDGALPGVVMLDDPQLDDVYRQEYYEGEAEDYAIVVSLDETVEVPAGSFTNCLKTRDKSAIDPTLDEFKYYCPGIGNVLVEEGDVRVELVEYSGL